MRDTNYNQTQERSYEIVDIVGSYSPRSDLNFGNYECENKCGGVVDGR